jgi:hypothetical protein
MCPMKIIYVRCYWLMFIKRYAIGLIDYNAENKPLVSPARRLY